MSLEANAALRMVAVVCNEGVSRPVATAAQARAAAQAELEKDPG